MKFSMDYQENGRLGSTSITISSVQKVPLPSEEYPLNIGGFTGVDADLFNHPLYPINWMKFSTPNNDNDKSSGGTVAMQLSIKVEDGTMTITA